VIKPPAPARPTQAQGPRGYWNSTRLKLLLLAGICVAPVAASYLAYYVFRPGGGGTNYGALIEPQRPIPPALIVRDEKGATVPLDQLKGKWLMISVDAAACDEACAKKLYIMRQVRATQSGERDRVLTVWLRTSDAPVPPVIARAYPDTRFLSAPRASLAGWLPVNDGSMPEQHIYLVDPNGNLMMRFPANPDATKVKNDLTRLLKWSGIG
jgi:hypothetical protein